MAIATRAITTQAITLFFLRARHRRRGSVGHQLRLQNAVDGVPGVLFFFCFPRFLFPHVPFEVAPLEPNISATAMGRRPERTLFFFAGHRGALRTACPMVYVVMAHTVTAYLVMAHRQQRTLRPIELRPKQLWPV